MTGDPAHDPSRAVRVIILTPVERDQLSDKAWARRLARQWEVVLPLRATAARNSRML